MNANLGTELGRLYVKRYFPPEVRAQVQTMVTNLITVYRQRLQSITWMAPSTKAEAISQLDGLYLGIGYPEHWEEDEFEVKPDISSTTSGAAVYRSTSTNARFWEPQSIVSAG